MIGDISLQLYKLIDYVFDLYIQVGKLKRKLSEKRQQRPKSATLKSISQSKLSSSSPETKRSGRQGGSKVVINMEHWRHALEQVTPSVSKKEKAKYQRM